MHNFKKLKIYERALAYCIGIYRISRKFPADELYGITSQIRRASSSIVLNIAEGAGNEGAKEFSRFLGFSIRSAFECIACCDIARGIDIMTDETANELTHEAEEIVSMMVGLQRTLKKK